ncbi:hypothetical protein [Oleiharenicola lentus]|uniref:hypothetical protein n=1 Tax=Oleiharenicola lentus TaxID=2508720 RepID=UPI003F66CA92
MIFKPQYLKQLRPLAMLALSFGLALASHAATPKRANEIVVSSANYAEASPEVLAKLFRKPADLTNVTPPPATEKPARYYQFLPSESLSADLSYSDVCKLLLSPLAAKNLHNTADQAKVELILRVTFGETRWRDPFVRKDNLEWSHGLIPKKRGTSLDAAQAWDERAGGDESALYQLERDSGVEGMADRLIGGMNTEDYYLIVVDAFEVAELKLKGNKTPRAWTTFIAVPRQKGVKFSDVAVKMIEKAAPYFGETLTGKARFTDREGSVKIGDLNIIEDNVATPKK